MHKSNSYLAAAISGVLVLMGGFFYSPVALSQEADEDALEEIVVTASRREEKLQDVALAVTVIDVDDYTNAGLAGLSDILSFVPGVSLQDVGVPFNNTVYVRGINSTLAAGVVSYVDELPFGSSTVYANSAVLDGTLLDLGTLDVMKGPQGTLYGASAMGGILKFNTRRASLEEWTGSVTADLSDTHGGGLNQLYRVNANGPIVSDNLGASFTAFYKDKSGYIDNVTIPQEGWDDYEYYGGSGNLYWQVSDKLDVKLQGLYQKSTQDGTAQIEANYADDALLPGVGAGESWAGGDYETGQAQVNPSNYEAQVIGLTINYDLGFGTFTSVSGVQEMEFSQSIDLTVPFAFFADIFFPANAPHTSALLVASQGFDKFTQEFRLTSKSTQKFEWIVGGFYNKEEGFNIQELVLTPSDPMYFANFPSDYEEYSFFATGTWYFTPDFDASVGVRYADYSNDVELTTVGPLVAPLPLTEIEDDVTNYLFNVRYRMTDNTSVYGRIASGYRPGGANFLILDASGNPLTNPFFEPDSLWSYEAGIKGTSDDGRWGYDFSVFYIDWQDYIITVNIGGVNVAGNADKAQSQGTEAALSYAVTDAFTIQGSLAYVNAELGSDQPELGGADGDQLPNSPQWQTTLDFDYQFNIGDVPAYVGAAWRYKGEMPVGWKGYTDAGGVFHAGAAPHYDVDAYHLVDLRSGVTFGQFEFSLYVTNLFDEYAYTNFGPSRTAASLATPTRPRTIGAVVRWDFF